MTDQSITTGLNNPYAALFRETTIGRQLQTYYGMYPGASDPNETFQKETLSAKRFMGRPTNADNPITYGVEATGLSTDGPFVYRFYKPRDINNSPYAVI